MPRPAAARPRHAWLASAALAAIAGGSLFDIALGREDWPFSSYPMFAEPRPRERPIERLELAGVAARDGAEVPVRRIAPFDRGRLLGALERLAREPATRPALEAALRDCLRRAAADERGPALRAIRLYRVEWSPDPAAADLDRPEGRRLLAEVAP
jgi:hypothetical protein